MIADIDSLFREYFISILKYTCVCRMSISTQATNKQNTIRVGLHFIILLSKTNQICIFVFYFDYCWNFFNLRNNLFLF